MTTSGGDYGDKPRREADQPAPAEQPAAQPGQGTPAPYPEPAEASPPPPAYGYSAPGSPDVNAYGSGFPSGYGQPRTGDSPTINDPASDQRPQLVPGTNRLAIAALISSCIGWLIGIGAIVGIVLGVMAINRIKQTPQVGYGMAVAAIAVGIAALAVQLIVFTYAVR